MIKVLITAGILLSANLLANSYEDGYEEYKNEKFVKAIKIWSQGCDQGDTKSCVAKGTMFLKGQGVKKDTEKAKELYNKACEAGDKVACKHYEKLNKDD